jgi:hypothetical protein
MSLRNRILEQARRDRAYLQSLPPHQQQAIEREWALIQRRLEEGAHCDANARTSSQ